MTYLNRTQSIAARESSPCPTSSPAALSHHAARHRGFTLLELLAVIIIISLVSAVALPVVLPALSHRQVSEAARILQGALVGARDAALHNGTPSGIRLLPDPAFPLIYKLMPDGTTQIDPTQPFAANRIIPIETAPEYTSGILSIVQTGPNGLLNIPYPAVNGGGFYPFANNSIAGICSVLMVKEIMAQPGANNVPVLNEPTSWFWNIRVGDKLQINRSGLWYTVVGPMWIPPQGVTYNGIFYANSEMFVNMGPPGTQSPVRDLQSGAVVNPEFLLLVNGLDDNNNGWIDEGYDGVNNNLAFEVANGLPQIVDDLLEWEFELWPASLVPSSQPYTIQRRPAPTANAREVSLPTHVVIDMTMLVGTLPSSTGTSMWPSSERSQFPPGVINPYTGYVDILLNPNGTVVPTTLYSTPSSFGMLGAYFHFWLAERSDVVPITFDANSLPVPQVANQPVFLPVGNINQQLVVSGKPYTGQSLKGEYRIVTLSARTGQVTTNDDPQFDNPMLPANTNTIKYNPGYPFLSAAQGSKGSR